MVTKATRDVLNLNATGRPITDFVLSGTGVSSIDSTPIGATTPDIGNFSSSSIAALSVGTTANFGAASISGGVWGYPIATAAQVIALTSSQKTIVETIGGTLVKANIGDLPVNTAISTAVLGTAISAKRLAISANGTIVLNNTALPITPTTGLTAANLVTDGFILVGGSPRIPDTAGFMHNNGTGVITWAPVITPASLTVPIQNNSLVLSSDGVAFFNKSGAAITPISGLTSANLITDGFTSLSSGITDALVGVIILDNAMVVAADSSILVNNTGVPITIAAPITRAGLIAQGFTFVGGGPAALFGNITPATIAIRNGAILSTTLASSNGTAPFTWTVSTGVLPAGLALNAATGVLSGTPTGIGNTPYNFTINATDANMNYNTQLYSGAILGNPIVGGTIAPTTVAITNGVANTVTLVPAGGVAPYTYTVQAGTLPVGMSLNATTGVISGTPTGAVGTAYNFTIRATDSAGNFIDKVYTGTIVSAGPPAVYPNKIIFNGTGADQTFTVPVGASWVRFKMWGAGGGGFTTLAHGAVGGYSIGEVAATPGAVYTIVVGSPGSQWPGAPGIAYGGGGPAGASLAAFSNPECSGGGGLSGVFTDASFATATPAGAIIIAGGGAGSAYTQGAVSSGSGGGLSGLMGNGPSGGIGIGQPPLNSSTAGWGGTQLAGGAGSTTNNIGLPDNATAGSQFLGGTGGNTAGEQGGGGGGGGWFGGGGGPSCDSSSPTGAGGGGSGYLSATLYGTSASTLSGASATPNSADPDRITAGNPSTVGKVVVEWI